MRSRSDYQRQQQQTSSAMKSAMNSSFENLIALGSPGVIRVVPSSRPTDSVSPVKFPKRPDLTVLSETIPLFYIGRNKYGFWVARESEGRSGGVFLCQRSALRFARSRSEPVGCATMFLNETFELDVENQGSHVVAPLSAMMDLASQRLPTVAAFVGMAVAEWRKLIAEISRAVVGKRRNRDAIERELFRGRYRLVSKADDDLPVA
jgi:hypothetical protein